MMSVDKTGAFNRPVDNHVCRPVGHREDTTIPGANRYTEAQEQESK